MRGLAVTFLLATVIVECPVAGQDAPAAVTVPADGLEADLNLLADPQFRNREAAARRLASRKFAAVAPLAELARSGSAEASVRAFEILRQIYRDGDDATCEAVETALESLSRSENVFVATRAESSIDAVASTWHRRAIDAFVRLGGVIRYFNANSGIEPADGDKYDRPIQYAIINKSWAGGDEGLKHLRRIEDFRVPTDVRGASLYVINGTVTKPAIAALEAALPNLQVQQRGPACLGVTPGIQGLRPAEKGLMVAFVKEGSAAQLAGIRVNDVILKFNGHEVNDFETLVDKISEKQPGDKVAVVFLRDDVEETTTVELRGWD